MLRVYYSYLPPSHLLPPIGSVWSPELRSGDFADPSLPPLESEDCGHPRCRSDARDRLSWRLLDKTPSARHAPCPDVFFELACFLFLLKGLS